MTSVSDYEKKQAADKAAREEYLRRTEDLKKIIHPLKEKTWGCDFDWRYLHKAFEGFRRDYGSLEMNPDFQRGHVWTPEQQQHFIENVLRGVVGAAGLVIQFNCANWDEEDYEGDLPKGMQCVDGLQRLTAVEKFLTGEIRPFGLTLADLDRSAYSINTKYRFRIEVYNFTWRAELLQHYLDLNAGGTPHSPEEIARVRTMKESALAATGSVVTASKQAPGM